MQGADYLYSKVQPVLRRYQPKIDICLDQLYVVLVRRPLKPPLRPPSHPTLLRPQVTSA